MRGRVNRRRLVGAEERPASGESRDQQREGAAGGISVADKRVLKPSPPTALPGSPAGALTLPGKEHTPGLLVIAKPPVIGCQLFVRLALVYGRPAQPVQPLARRQVGTQIAIGQPV